MGCWFCSMVSKKSIRSGSGPFAAGTGFDAAGSVSGNARPVAALDSDSLFELVGNGLLAPLVPVLPFFNSCSARYCLRLISKSGSIK